MQLVVPGDQPGRRGSGSRGAECRRGRVGEPRIGGEAEVVVRRKVPQPPGLVRDARARARMQRPQGALQPGTGQGGKLLRQHTLERRGRGGRGGFGWSV